MLDALKTKAKLRGVAYKRLTKKLMEAARQRPSLILALAFFLGFPSDPVHAALPKPRLVLLVVIDQFRADYVTRFMHRFQPARKGAQVGGFKYLESAGAYFPAAEYDILQSMTAPGHATIVTGSYPYLSGIVANRFPTPDRTRMQGVTEDARDEQSPRALSGTTIGDELKNSSPKSRVVSIALKDRASILMGGHRADAALWLDIKTFAWRSSRYYWPSGDPPEWLARLNASLNSKKGAPLTWQGHKADTGSYESQMFPVALDWTVQAATQVLDSYQLGKRDVTDFLAVSYSSFDYAGHTWGPYSREMEDLTVAVDHSLAQLLNAVRARVPGGLKDVMIVLTADHGIAPSPEWARENKIQAAPIDVLGWRDQLNTALAKKFGALSGGALYVPLAYDFHYFLNRAAIESKGVDIAAVEGFAKNFLSGETGAFAVFTRSDVSARKLPPGMLERQILHSYFDGRSGDIQVIPKPFYVNGREEPVTHITGYSYDRSVPLFLVGNGIFKPGTYRFRTLINDVAPTLASILGVIAPALSEGRVLHEVIVAEKASGFHE